MLALVLAALLGPPVVNGSAAPQKPAVEEVRDDFGATADLQNRVFTIRYRGIDEVYSLTSRRPAERNEERIDHGL